MKESSLKRYPGLTNIKSGPGGIADIDFIAQSYAAHYGKNSPGIRHHETTAILNALGKEGFINRQEIQTLRELYTFLSDVEKVLRISSGTAVNTLPTPGVERARVARLLGFKTVGRLMKRLDDVRALTSEYYDRLMKELCDLAGNGQPQS
jgi:glutamate-ammonia-ligase adenylyltransferase